MAQTGYSKVQIYSSSTATNTPSAGNLTNDTNGSELAINITDGKLFYKDNSGTVQVLATKGGAFGTVTSVAATVPSFLSISGSPINSSGTLAITLSGTALPTTSGGTGLTSFTANGVVYASSTSALTTGSALVFDGTNLGLGVTPSAWSGYRVFQIGSSTAIYSDGSSNELGLVQNAYYSTGWKYGVTGAPASWNYQYQGQYFWKTAPSGTAGNAITFTQAMTLDVSGNLTIAGSTATKASGTTWANPSDTRLKNNQALYTKGLTELNQIKVKTWVYNGLGGSLNGQTGIGVIADEAMIVLPDTVDTYSAKLNPTDSEETDIKRFNASEVIWLLVTSLQELDAKFEEYKATHP